MSVNKNLIFYLSLTLFFLVGSSLNCEAQYASSCQRIICGFGEEPYVYPYGDELLFERKTIYVGHDTIGLLVSLPEGCHRVYLKDSSYLEIVDFGDDLNFLSWGKFQINEQQKTIYFQQCLTIDHDFWLIHLNDFSSVKEVGRLLAMNRNSFVYQYNDDFVCKVYNTDFDFDTINKEVFNDNLFKESGGKLHINKSDSLFINTSGVVAEVIDRPNGNLIRIGCGLGVLNFMISKDERLQPGMVVGIDELNRLIRKSQDDLVFFEFRIHLI
jgi:hypothetical protein